MKTTVNGLNFITKITATKEASGHRAQTNATVRHGNIAPKLKTESIPI